MQREVCQCLLLGNKHHLLANRLILFLSGDAPYFHIVMKYHYRIKKNT